VATSSIPQLPQAVSLTGAELLELAQLSGAGHLQSFRSIRASIAQVLLLASQIAPTGPVGVATDAPSGANNNYTANNEFGPLIGFIDLTPPTNCNITGLMAGFDGQIVTITNLAPGVTVTLNALNGGSVLANQFRMVADFLLPTNNSKSFRYSATIGKWVAL